jgi:hypothetical protein
MDFPKMQAIEYCQNIVSTHYNVAAFLRGRADYTWEEYKEETAKYPYYLAYGKRKAGNPRCWGCPNNKILEDR